MKTQYIGKPVSRVDGLAKVTGTARYSADFKVDRMLYGYIVSGSIAKGKIISIDTSKAMGLKGVLQVFTHENVSGLPWFSIKYKDMDAPSGSPFRPLHDDKILYSGQPVALVVADTFELARYASSLIDVLYEEESFATDLAKNIDRSYKAPVGKIGYVSPKSRGDADEAYGEAEFKMSGTYQHGAEHHNPMELFSTTAIWENGKLTVYDKTQGVTNCQFYIGNVFGLAYKDVRIISPYVGGAFGSGLRPQYQLFMAVLASLELKRPVKVGLTRQQMFTFGHRPVTMQKLALSASADGSLESIRHEAYSETSRFESYTEIIVNWSGTMYNCDHVKLKYELVGLDMYTPVDMRAPGAVTGAHAMESAMDELAYELKMDPLIFRLKNYADEDQTEEKPFSSKELIACYREGAEKFGWTRRNIEPRSMREGNQLIGWGVATAAWDAFQMPCRAKALLSIDGKLVISSGTSDIGTGTYTIMTQIAAESLGLKMEDVTFQLGDTNMPMAPLEGGSWTAASVGSAVKGVCEDVKKKLIKMAVKTKTSPLYDSNSKDIVLDSGMISDVKNSSKSASIVEVMRLAGINSIEETSTSGPNPINKMKYTFNAHAAVFAEVKVDEDLGIVRVTRVVCAVAAGKILNPKTARSQILGGVVWGISKALEEESKMDHQYGRFMNHNLSEYHVPVNKDINDIEVIFVEEKDDIVNPLGVKGVGEIGIIGVAGAIANAVFHATGVRVRNLPITMDKVLQIAEDDRNQVAI
ncbi:xanthine dehydrogenase family protein molybdopterin-binding subunit [Dyadobacter sp. LJ53]|uniref:xanthine dehydrogenase family protein molybdopterin-binding subunit n=1 Tax=Dyadobacter chenwenxiniae TaxID=2906456 RepID=UPI001F1CF6D9|nr:xanthine dehydrogenase family protein molybdopterin-binding subunit [Dyadobacter chenwenxiniae]MCF0048823.1 xanthine dehydrogenase family protein molybdopterin-binding subunit [Dyadobacter chenwenxiniae]